MSWELFVALAGFSFVSSITPGPNNLMLLASGVNFGFRPTIPHMLGISCGFAFLLFCVGSGLGQLIEHFPMVALALKIAGGTYLLYLAWCIATSGPMEDGNRQKNDNSTAGKPSTTGKPMTLLGAAAFQWVNPKAWMMAITAMSNYTLVENYWQTMAIVVVTFTLINLPCVSCWASFGTSMRMFLSNPKKLRIFNIAMAMLLVASLWPMVR